jgi:hypothetical protein
MDSGLSKETLLQTVGNELKNAQGKPIGRVVEAIPDDQEQPIRYLVLQTDILFGLKDRFFAIPVSPDVLEIGENNQVMLKIRKVDLIFARGTRGRDFPKAFLKKEGPIFEIYEYKRA